MASVQDLISSSKVLVLSKSYCPYCRTAKQTLGQFNPQGMKILELDQIPNGGKLQAEAASLTGQRTVPNIWIGGKHIGGNSDLQSLGSATLQQYLVEAGAK
uniref:Glutaredoxin domain-containing protein n=1 Tax=Aplanochytrium stocchinoi TaxID=215587 RepID=A0A7S3LME2_9STRA|mmetsp:Transcript_3171/g.4024  ORF Transcript_3171/g.4024 Transcript_3171/m.4024 type:complete len:101 (-) Transcript_3171:231-533(-)|eukprot:CAMPEP_0204848522 /NCGR_PEP_ID=MMETSP1347-20130617/4375_1 /ASSEMBLY_ACC=CAM_ASM_000690 /TAXON_ID=215587 /ORGANISM="Aplanochytrium stocchinoi, Strain GSBS06" /LENGTH=100 /DNA_ID=CAMNT_0051990151 /DNA_START=147 /DNA_END=449 /DNA_ORIENTATION=+